MAVPDPLPTQMILHPSKWKWIGVISVGVIFAVIGVWMIIEKGDAIGWACTIFFGLVVAAGVAQLVIGELRLEEDHFVESVIFRRRECRWDEVTAFGVWQANRNHMVTFEKPDDVSRLAKTNRRFAGMSSSLGDTYGLKAEDLAELMIAFHDRAMQNDVR